MKYFKCFFLLHLLVFSLAISQESNHQQRVALIVNFSGDVTFETARSAVPSKAWLGMDLMAGDTVYLGSNGWARLLFLDSNLVKLEPNTKLIVGSSTSESRIGSENGISRTVSSTDLIATCIPRVNVATLTMQSYRALTSETRDLVDIKVTPSILTILPAKSVYRINPVFMWYDPNLRRGTGKDQEYTLIVYQRQRENPNSGDIILKEITRRKITGKPRTFITYEIPSTLTYASSYEWDVFGPGEEPENSSNYKPYGSFRIVDSLKAMEIDKMVKCITDHVDDKTIEQIETHLLIGSYLKGQRFFAEATIEYEKVADTLKSSYPYEELVLLYDRCGDQAQYKRNQVFEKVKNFWSTNPGN